MNTKDAIEFLGKEIKSRTLYCGGIIVGFEESPRDKKLTQVIELLQRGEKFEQMWGEIKENTSQYDRGKDTLDKIYELEQKYSPKPKEV